MSIDTTDRESSTPLLTARRVSDADRMGTLPRHFGRLMMRVEQSIYQWMETLCPDYTGGYWEFYEVSNGAFYMFPHRTQPWCVTCPNQFEGELSSEAAGITACLYALSDLCFSVESTALTDHFHALRDFASEHAEAALIFQAID